MAWNAAQVNKLMTQLISMNNQQTWQMGQQVAGEATKSVVQQTRKDIAGTSWDCPTCGFYNYGNRSTCFAYKQDGVEAKLNKTAGPSSKTGG
eukprot:6368067-Amphidinium_carterae.1